VALGVSIRFKPANDIADITTVIGGSRGRAYGEGNIASHLQEFASCSQPSTVFNGFWRFPTVFPRFPEDGFKTVKTVVYAGSSYLSVTSPSPSILPVAVLPGGTNWQATMLPLETNMPFLSVLPWSPSLLASQASAL
jgi:hypothetical protein